MLRLYHTWRVEHPDQDLNRYALICGMSANAPNDDVQQTFRECGMHLFSTKPIRAESLDIILRAKKAVRDGGDVVQEIRKLITESSSRDFSRVSGRSVTQVGARVVGRGADMGVGLGLQLKPLEVC